MRGAGVDRPGATDTTMLIWKVIHANPGITRDEIFARIEHEIPAGWAKRRYQVHSRSYGLKGSGPYDLDVTRARGFVLTEVLGDMRRRGSVARDETGGYRTLRPIKNYIGNRDHVDEGGTRAAEHLNAIYALPIAEGFLARTEIIGPNGKSRPSAKEWAALQRVVKAYRDS